MNLNEAIKLLNNGKRICRQDWNRQYFLEKDPLNIIKTYVNSTSHFNWTTSMFLEDDWIIMGDNNTDVSYSSFPEAIEALKLGKTVRLPDWKEAYLIYDHNMKTVVLKNFYIHDWTPTFEDLCAEDWDQY